MLIVRRAALPRRRLPRSSYQSTTVTTASNLRTMTSTTTARPCDRTIDSRRGGHIRAWARSRIISYRFRNDPGRDEFFIRMGMPSRAPIADEEKRLGKTHAHHRHGICCCRCRSKFTMGDNIEGEGGWRMGGRREHPNTQCCVGDGEWDRAHRIVVRSTQNSHFTDAFSTTTCEGRGRSATAIFSVGVSSRGSFDTAKVAMA